MNKYLKYLLSLFLAFSLIVNDCTIDFQSKTADYYQSSVVISRQELDFRNSRLYVFQEAKSAVKTSFLISVKYLNPKAVLSLQVKVVLKLQTRLHQSLRSFIKQSIFVNEIITSNIFGISLYTV